MQSGYPPWEIKVYSCHGFPLGDGMQDKTTKNLLFGDLLACTPLAENVRRWRSARVSDSVMDEILREKLRPMFETMVNQHADLLKPAWA